MNDDAEHIFRPSILDFLGPILEVNLIFAVMDLLIRLFSPSHQIDLVRNFLFALPFVGPMLWSGRRVRISSTGIGNRALEIPWMSISRAEFRRQRLEISGAGESVVVLASVVKDPQFLERVRELAPSDSPLLTTLDRRGSAERQ